MVAELEVVVEPAVFVAAAVAPDCPATALALAATSVASLPPSTIDPSLLPHSRSHSHYPALEPVRPQQRDFQPPDPTSVVVVAKTINS